MKTFTIGILQRINALTEEQKATFYSDMHTAVDERLKVYEKLNKVEFSPEGEKTDEQIKAECELFEVQQYAYEANQACKSALKPYKFEGKATNINGKNRY